MHKTPNILFSFTLPFFIALVFMLSAFTYSMGGMFSKPTSTTTRNTKQLDSNAKVANVLGITDETTSEEDNEVIIENTDPSTEKPQNYSSVVNNADGTRTEINGYLDNGDPKVNVKQFDMFGVLSSEKTYTEQEYEAIRSKTDGVRRASEGMVTLENLPDKLSGLGYTYNPTKVTLVKDGSSSSFKVPAQTTQKMFGLFKINLPVVLLVNSSDGSISISKSLFIDFLDLISK